MTALKSIQATENDYPQSIDIWGKSVQETHHYLLTTDFETIKKEMPTHFSNVEVQIWLDQNDIIGFSGVSEQKLEMLFLDPAFIRKGYAEKY